MISPSRWFRAGRPAQVPGPCAISALTLTRSRREVKYGSAGDLFSRALNRGRVVHSSRDHRARDLDEARNGAIPALAAPGEMNLGRRDVRNRAKNDAGADVEAFHGLGHAEGRDA